MLDYKVSDDRWKEELRKEIVTAITGSPSEKIKAFGQVGYYYQCHAPATIYKYFRDDQRSLEAVKCNKLCVKVYPGSSGEIQCRHCKLRFHFYVDSQAKSMLSVRAKPIK